MKTGFVVLVFTSTACIFLLGCGAVSQQRTSHMPGTAASLTPVSLSPDSDASTTTALPGSAATDSIRLSLLLEDIFKAQPNLNRLDDLHKKLKGQIRQPSLVRYRCLSVVSNCDLDILKRFVTTGWAPVVLLSYEDKQHHLWAVTGYDDKGKQIQLAKPGTRALRKVSYANFREGWASASTQKCILVTPNRLNSGMVRSALREYLPARHISRVKVKSQYLKTHRSGRSSPSSNSSNSSSGPGC